MLEDNIETSEIKIFWFLAIGPSASSKVTVQGISRGQMNNKLVELLPVWERNEWNHSVLVTLQRQTSKTDFSQRRSALHRTCITLHFNSPLCCCVYFWNEWINNSNSDNTPSLLCSELQRRCHSKDFHRTASMGISCDLGRARQWEDGATDSQQLSDLELTVWKCVYIYTIYCS